MPSEYYKQNEAKLTLGLLNAVHDDQSITQRSISKDLGVALGLVNTYLKRCVKTGLIKVTQAPSSRYAYYLTPKGFAEKSRLTARYLSQSMSFFRQVRVESSNLLRLCADKGWRRIILIGKSELCEITILGASDHVINIVAIIDEEAALTTGTFMGIPVYADVDQVETNAKTKDTYLITDIKAPQETYDTLVKKRSPDRVLAMPFLGISPKDTHAVNKVKMS